ncbi:lipopolysaccharide biosynthesis protein [Pontibacter vulgaris]|uniref:lipopolysaccharide biosynthesis protein n=1 Tax=Pontibacter vulgaris TaxID=2905679 RepID=UPI001FA7FA1E|nr:lipopolysaccharide biosynthesis protein [Pontibacter vulgaris]
MSKNLTSKTVSGIQWSTASTITTSLMQIIYTAIMARLLDPAAFGLVALSGVVLRFASYFAQMGMSQALIQKEQLSKEDIRSAFTSSLFLGIIFFAIMWLIAPLSIYIFKNEEVIPVIRVMALSFVISGLSSTSVSLLRREMRFKNMAVVEISAYVIGYIGIGITSAYMGMGVWSLVYASLSSAFIVAILSYATVRHNIAFLFSWVHYKPLLAFGGRVSFISFLEFLGGNLDTILIGRLMGASALGLYNRAYMLVNLPIHSITVSISRVLFPAFSRLQSETARLRKAYVTVISLAAYFIIPACVGAAVASEQIVLVVLGDKWTAAIPLLQILALAIPLLLLNHFAGIICEATNTLNIKAVLQIGSVTAMVILLYLLKGFGVTGFATAFLLSVFFRTIAYAFVTRKVLGLRLKAVLKAYAPATGTAIITGGAIYLAAYGLKNLNMPQLVILIAEAVVGFLMLVLLLFMSPNKHIKSEIYYRITNTFNINETSFKGKILLRVSSLLAMK